MSETEELRARAIALGAEVAELRERLARHPRDLAQVEKWLTEARADARSVAGQNERLARALRDAKDRIITLKTQLDALGAPPLTFGILDELLPDSAELRLADIQTANRRVRTSVSDEVSDAELIPGAQVLLNESLVIVGTVPAPQSGEVTALKDVLDTRRAVVTAHADEELVVRLSEDLMASALKPGDLLLVDRKVLYAFEVVPKIEVEDLVLEEVPDIDYESIGGLTHQIEQIQDAVELPFLHADLYAEYDLRAPKGVLLYGPPGCGKTMIAKAVANSLARKITEQTGEEGRSFFLNVKGPELLNKYVGETERHIRLIFQRARAKASEGMPVIVFFDEMDSLFRTRGSGVSSDVETTIVPQLLSELDGVEGLDNVIVIGASNREDMIDPAILRPGRLDVKIKIERPDAEAAREIFARYFTPGLPLDPPDRERFGDDPQRCRAAMIDAVVTHMYAESPENRFLEVTYSSGDKEILYFKDFASGAMIQNIVGRAKKSAIKQRLRDGSGGISIDHLLQACDEEFAENEDLPNTTNPDDWARISGKKGERIAFIRTLFTAKHPTNRSIDTAANTGQYL